MRSFGRTEIGDLDVVQLLHDGKELRARGSALSITDDENIGEIKWRFGGRNVSEEGIALISETLRERIGFAVDCHVFGRHQEVFRRSVRRVVQSVPT